MLIESGADTDIIIKLKTTILQTAKTGKDSEIISLNELNKRKELFRAAKDINDYKLPIRNK